LRCFQCECSRLLDLPRLWDPPGVEAPGDSEGAGEAKSPAKSVSGVPGPGDSAADQERLSEGMEPTAGVEGGAEATGYSEMLG
jgi:hypothetical protein